MVYTQKTCQNMYVFIKNRACKKYNYTITEYFLRAHPNRWCLCDEEGRWGGWEWGGNSE